MYGYAQGVIGAGAVLGGLIAGVCSKNLKSTASPFILAGCGVSILFIGVALQTLSSSMAIYMVMAIGSGLLVALSTLFQIQVMTYLQMLTPQSLIGKVISCFICVCMCTNPLGQFLYGMIFEKIGDNPCLPFYVASLIMIGISIFTRHIFYGMDDLIEK